jgi:hypothetical protein
MLEDSSNVKSEIKRIFDENKLDDLKRFMSKRQFLNQCSVYMLYLFHLIQSAGILISSVGASTSDTKFIWTGIALNMVASIIQVYEKINDGQLKRLFRDIKAIKDDKYVDESPLVDTVKDFQGLNKTLGMSQDAYQYQRNSVAYSPYSPTTPTTPYTQYPPYPPYQRKVADIDASQIKLEVSEPEQEAPAEEIHDHDPDTVMLPSDASGVSIQRV